MNKILLKRDIEIDFHYAEAIKTLRTNILFSGKNTKVIMITSALPDEGKSDVTFALAKSLAQIGKKVVFVDTDIRKSVMTTRYNVGEKIRGLSQYLCEQNAMEEIIYDTDEQGLCMVFAGPPSPTAAELLEEQLFSDLISSLREDYDYVVVDTPPLGVIIDSAIVAKSCDGVVMVIESGAISYRLEQTVKEQLEKTGCRILGVVLNKVDVNSGSYYGKYGKYGKYGRYGKYEYTREKTKDETEGAHA